MVKLDMRACSGYHGRNRRQPRRQQPENGHQMQQAHSSRARIGTCLALTLAALAVDARSAQWDGPFGLRQGLTPADVGKVITIKKLADSSMYSADTLPMTDAAFVRYGLTFSASSGLCAIVAMGPDKPSDGLGKSLKQDYQAMQKKIVAAYGEPSREIDRLRDNSKWTDARDYTMSIYWGDRALTTVWRSDASRTLPASLQTIALMAKAESPMTAELSVHYRFANTDDCEADAKAREARRPQPMEIPGKPASKTR